MFSCHFSQPQFFVRFGPLWISQVVVKSRALNDAKFECGSDPRLSYVEALASVRARSRRVHSGPTLSVGCGMDFEIALRFEGRLEKNGFSLHRTASRSWSLDASWRNGETFNKRVSNMVVIKQSTINIRPCNAKLNPCSTLAEPLLRVQLLGSCLFVLDVLGSY